MQHATRGRTKEVAQDFNHGTACTKTMLAICGVINSSWLMDYVSRCPLLPTNSALTMYPSLLLNCRFASEIKNVHSEYSSSSPSKHAVSVMVTPCTCQEGGNMAQCFSCAQKFRYFDAVGARPNLVAFAIGKLPVDIPNVGANTVLV